MLNIPILIRINFIQWLW